MLHNQPTTVIQIVGRPGTGSLPRTIAPSDHPRKTLEMYLQAFIMFCFFFSMYKGGGRVERRCWVNFQCRGVLLGWTIVGQGPIALAVGAGGGCLDIFSLIYLFSFLSPSLWESARYRLKYCLKGPLNPKQPTNQIHVQKTLRKTFEMYLQDLIMFFFSSM